MTNDPESIDEDPFPTKMRVWIAVPTRYDTNAVGAVVKQLISKGAGATYTRPIGQTPFEGVWGTTTDDNVGIIIADIDRKVYASRGFRKTIERLHRILTRGAKQEASWITAYPVTRFLPRKAPIS